MFRCKPGLQPHHDMRYFIPDWEDRLDPDFDFATDSFSRKKADAYATDVYAHQLFRKPPYDGVLISLATFQGGKLPLQKNRDGRLNIRGFKTVRGYLRIRGRPLEVMGDCGAFDYVNEDRPPKHFSTKRVADLYEALGFDYGVSVDHMVVDFVYREGKNGRIKKVFLSDEQKEKRRRLSLRNARAFIAYWRKKKHSYVPVGAAQGLDAASYAESVKKLLKWGYRYVGLGTLIPKTDDEVIEILTAVKKVVNEFKAREHCQVGLHLFGILRPKILRQFESYGVSSIDSASYLRKAWLRSGQNYLTHEKKWLAAIRVPYSGNPTLVKNAKKEGISEEQLVVKETRCLELLKKYAARRVTIKDTLRAVLDYDQLLLREFDGNHHHDKYEKTLKERPWEKCGCAICRRLGIDVVIFRGCNRNKRRGFHNTKVFYDKILHGKAPPNDALLVVGCGKAKTWNKKPRAGRVAAKDAYTSSLFKLCRRYAEKHFPGRWVILSAKYGFVHPDQRIGNYNVHFQTNRDAVSDAELIEQWQKKFSRIKSVTSLTSSEYNSRLKACLPPALKLHTPMKGMGLYERLAWLAGQTGGSIAASV